MGYKDVTPGKKIAKAVGIRAIVSSKGTNGIEVVFEFDEPSTQTKERLSWTGWLSDGAMARTVDTLTHVLGYNGCDDTDANGVFTDPNTLDWKREVELVCEQENYTNAEGEERSSVKIKWVNAKGGGAFAAAEPAQIKSVLGGKFKAAFLAAKQKNAVAAPAQQASVPEVEVPF